MLLFESTAMSAVKAASLKVLLNLCIFFLFCTFVLIISVHDEQGLVTEIFEALDEQVGGVEESVDAVCLHSLFRWTVFHGACDAFSYQARLLRLFELVAWFHCMRVSEGRLVRATVGQAARTDTLGKAELCELVDGRLENRACLAHAHAQRDTSNTTYLEPCLLLLDLEELCSKAKTTTWVGMVKSSQDNRKKHTKTNAGSDRDHNSHTRQPQTYLGQLTLGLRVHLRHFAGFWAPTFRKYGVVQENSRQSARRRARRRRDDSCSVAMDQGVRAHGSVEQTDYGL